jgi:hypothetical protein
LKVSALGAMDRLWSVPLLQDVICTP